MVLKFLLRFLAFLCFCLNTAHANDKLNLPALGDSSSSIVSFQEEYQTGQSWLRAFRRQAPIQEDPLLFTYTYSLIEKLATVSPLQVKYFDLLMVDSKDFNAFAVPGNVIGINSGLFLHADSEDQLSSVIAHELAHLSQRHYARSLGRRKSQGLATLAAILGGLLIAAAGEADAGMAAVTAAQAASISNQLKYSRLQEQEADRIGMQTLVSANMNPQALAHMFQHMLAATRYRKDIREYDFLLTHPLADSRVADAFNQARQYPARPDKDSLSFHLMKYRVYMLHNSNAQDAIEHFSHIKNERYPEAVQYGLALAYMKNNQPKEALHITTELYKSSQYQTAYIIALLDNYQQLGRLNEASSLAEHHLSLSPNSYPLSMKLAQIYQNAKQYHESVRVLRKLAAFKKPDTPDVWYLLAENEGLAGNIAQVHLARSEYFTRLGAFKQALKHLNLAKPLLEDDPKALSMISLKITRLQKLDELNQF